MSCLYLNCSNPPTYTCSCGNICKSLCDIHINEHVKDLSHYHNPIAINRPPNTRKIVIKYLIASLSSAKSAKRELVQKSSALIKSIESQSKKIFEQLSAFEVELSSLISRITFNHSLDKSNLTRIIEMNPQNAEVECSKWRFISCNFDLSTFLSSVNLWNPVFCSLESLYANNSLPEIPPPSQQIPLDSTYLQFAPSQISKFDVFPPNNYRTCEQDLLNRTSPPKIELKASKIVNPPINLPNFSSTSKPPMNPPCIFNPPKVFQPENRQNLLSSSIIPIIPMQNPQKILVKQQLYCKKSHILTFSLYTPFIYWEQKRSFLVYCDICEKSFSQSSWNCSPCSYDICDPCALKLDMKSSNLVCNQNHELEFRYDVIRYYSKLGLDLIYRCQSCRANNNEPHWHCRICRYDLCTRCAERKGFFPYLNKAKCKKLHVLMPSFLEVPLRDFGLAVNCSICYERIAGDVFKCGPCNYHLCLKCKNFIERNIAQHPVFVCGTGHYLNWVILRVALTCNYCLKKDLELFVCISCEFKVCMECGDALLRAIKTNERKCNYCGHKLMWSPRCTEVEFRNANRECGFCRIGYENNGMFSCGNCRRMACVLCLENLGRQKPQVFSQDDVLLANALVHYLR